VEFGLKETTRPQFVSAALSLDAPGGATAPHRLALQFDEDVSGSLAAGDLSLRDSFSGAVVAPSEMAISFEDGGQRAIVTFPGRPNGRLPAGTWQLAVGAASVTDRAGNALAAPVAQDLAVNSAVAARHLFYNNSAFDLQDSAAGPADDAALAGKTPLLAAPGAAGARVAVLGTSSFDNVTSYAKGINGVMIDVGGAPLQRQWTADDFAFRVGRGGDPAAWESAPAPVAITVRPGAGEGGTDRVSLVWPDGAIRNTWLQVTVLATADTGLSAPDVFYFGNLVGETGARAGAGAAVSALDLWRTRRNFSAAVESAQSLFDHNHDGRVDILDLAIVRANVSRTLAPLVVPATPAESKAPARVAAVLGPVESADLLA